MIHAVLILRLSMAQITQLSGYCAAYRGYAWRALPPTAERNQTMRAVQAVQGRLSQARTEGVELFLLDVNEEEKQALRQAVSVLMHTCGAEPVSPERNRVLGELAGLRILIERTLHQTQILGETRGTAEWTRSNRIA